MLVYCDLTRAAATLTSDGASGRRRLVVAVVPCPCIDLDAIRLCLSSKRYPSGSVGLARKTPAAKDMADGSVGSIVGTATPRKTLQSVFACLTGFLPGTELNTRFFHGKAMRGTDFPRVPVWGRTVMLHFNMKLIRVGGHERTVVMRILSVWVPGISRLPFALCYSNSPVSDAFRTKLDSLLTSGGLSRFVMKPGSACVVGVAPSGSSSRSCFFCLL